MRFKRARVSVTLFEQSVQFCQPLTTDVEFPGSTCDIPVTFTLDHIHPTESLLCGIREVPSFWVEDVFCDLLGHIFASPKTAGKGQDARLWLGCHVVHWCELSHGRVHWIDRMVIS